MREIEFLPFRPPRGTDRRLWRIGSLVAVALMIAAFGLLHASRPVRISSAQTSASEFPALPNDEQPRRAVWTLPENHLTEDLRLDAVLALFLGMENESLLIETFQVRFPTILIDIRPHPDDRTAKPSHGPLAQQLGPRDIRPISAELQGFGATDLDIGMLVGRLSVCPFAGDVRLIEVSEAQFNDRRMRAFRIGIEFGHGNE